MTDAPGDPPAAPAPEAERSSVRTLVAIVLLGLALRLWGILHGFRDGFIYHPDSLFAVHDAWNHYLGAPWAPARFGVAYSVLLVLGMRALDGLSAFVGYPVAWTFELIASAISLVTAVLGTATIPIVYHLGAQTSGRGAGLLGALLLAVCPLHVLQSHYPYRDVPMTFFLAAALLGCVRLADRPTPLGYLLTALAAIVAAALKPAGLAVALPVVVAVLIALRRHRRVWVLVATGIFAVGAPVAVAWLKGARLRNPGAVWVGPVGFVATYLGRYAWRLGPGLGLAWRVLVDWHGILGVLAGVASVVWALARRRPVDLILVAFLGPAFVVAAMYPWLDERFLVFFLPAGAVLLSGGIAHAWALAARAPRLRGALALAVAGLALAGLVQSGWQGVLLSLPDTRALAGLWLEAHVPRETPVLMEGYPPLGAELWPNAAFFDWRQSVRQASAGADVLITSSLEHGRYLDEPDRYAPEKVAFFRSVPRELARMKTVALAPLGFLHSTIAIYAIHPPPSPILSRLDLPRPYDARWNDGVSFLDAGAYDRDDRTLRLSGSQGYSAMLVSTGPVDEIAVLVLNGPDPSRVRVRVGWTSRVRRFESGELRILHFRPRWPWPMRPALFRFEVGLVPEATEALIQLRRGAREIGEALEAWGRWADALPYLERAAAAAPADVDLGLRLAAAYRQAGRPADARRARDRLVTAAPEAVHGVRALAREAEGSEGWTRGFRALTGLEPALVTAALSQTLGAGDLRDETGRVGPDPLAPRGRSLAFDRRRDRPGVLLNGPQTLYLQPGAYRARFVLRAWDAAGPGPVAALRVFAETRLLAERALPAPQAGAGRGFVDVAVPFVHQPPVRRVAVQVQVTGRANLALDTIRLEPDLGEEMRTRARELAGVDEAVK